MSKTALPRRTSCDVYRLYVELLLKIVVILCRRLEHKESSFPLPHNLDKPWSETQAALLALWPQRDRDCRHLREALTAAARKIPGHSVPEDYREKHVGCVH